MMALLISILYFLVASRVAVYAQYQGQFPASTQLASQSGIQSSLPAQTLSYQAQQPVYQAQQPVYHGQQQAYQVQEPTYQSYQPQQPSYQAQQQSYETQRPSYQAQQPSYEAQQSYYQAQTPTPLPQSYAQEPSIQPQTQPGVAVTSISGQPLTNYQTQDGQQRSESVDEQGNLRGQYSYVDPSGRTLTVKYTAGEGGFQVEGDHLPQISGASPSAAGTQVNDVSQFSAQPQQLSAQSPSYQLGARSLFGTRSQLGARTLFSGQPQRQILAQPQYDAQSLFSSRVQTPLQSQVRGQHQEAPQSLFQLSGLNQPQPNPTPQSPSTVQQYSLFSQPQQNVNSHTDAVFHSTPQSQFTPEARSQYSLQEQTRFTPQTQSNSLFSQIQSLSRTTQSRASQPQYTTQPQQASQPQYAAQPPQVSQSLADSLLDVRPQTFPQTQPASPVGAQLQSNPQFNIVPQSSGLTAARIGSLPHEATASAPRNLPGAYNLELTL